MLRFFLGQCGLRNLILVKTEISGSTNEAQLSRGMLARLTRAMMRARGAASRYAVHDWVAGLADLAAEDKGLLASRLDAVIDCQVRVGDLAQGTVRGEPYLLAAEEARLALPDGSIVLLGDHDEPSSGSDVGDVMFPHVDGQSDRTLLDWLEEAGRERIALLQPIEAEGRWYKDSPIPELLEDLLSLCGEVDPAERTWRASAGNIAFLNDLLSNSTEKETEIGSSFLDDSQARVSSAEAGARIVVEAGPGSGKTHTACARVAHLLEAGVEGGRILLLSFTRIAVAELRARIAASDAPDVHAVEISTFDSLAGRYRAGVSVPSRGHDATVRTATALLKAGDPALVATVRQLRQVMIDEAQDLVGVRRDFCEALIAALHPQCGITVFGDPAQSIFSFQDKENGGKTLFSSLRGREDFQAVHLARDHRSQSEELARIVRDARPVLATAAEDVKQAYFDVRSLIIDNALQTGVQNFETHPSTSRGLVLLRSQRSLLTVAERFRAAGRSFRLHLPDRPLRLSPWIGAMLGGMGEGEVLDRAAAEALHASLPPGPLPDMDTCWEILRDLDGKGRPNIRIGRIAEALLDPPLALVRNYEGSSGPLLSTIHGIKGHEDERVMLGMTRAPKQDEFDWHEEARILYVGATRARRELRTFWVSPSRFYSSGSPKRYWRPTQEYLSMEIGLEDDIVDWNEFRVGLSSPEERAVIAATWAVSRGAPTEARLGPKGCMYVHQVGSEGPALARLSSGFIETAIRVARRPETSPLPDRLIGFDIAGATTVVVPPRSGELPTLALQPLLGGFARIPRE